MSDAPEVPDSAAVRKHGNLALKIWAPPALESEVRQAFRDFLAHLIETADAALLLGLSPSWADRTAPSEDTGALAELTSRRAPSPMGSDFVEIPRALLQAHIGLAARGTFNARRLPTPAGGLARDRFLHIATPLLVSTTSSISDAFAQLALPPEVQRHVYVVTNPFAGLAQNHSNALRQAIRDSTASAFLLWNGNSRSVQVHAGAATLERLRLDALAILAGP